MRDVATPIKGEVTHVGQHGEGYISRAALEPDVGAAAQAMHAAHVAAQTNGLPPPGAHVVARVHHSMSPPQQLGSGKPLLGTGSQAAGGQLPGSQQSASNGQAAKTTGNVATSDRSGSATGKPHGSKYYVDVGGRPQLDLSIILRACKKQGTITTEQLASIHQKLEGLEAHTPQWQLRLAEVGNVGRGYR